VTNDTHAFITAGEKQPTLARLLDPLGQQISEIPPHPPLFVQIVLEVVEQENQRQPGKELSSQHGQPVLPGLLGLAGVVSDLAQRIALVAAGGKA
jgi:hypothetical protein